MDAVNGAFMLMRRAALDRVGLFDEGYWMYMEDLDLCYRFARGGLGHLVRALGHRPPPEGRSSGKYRSPRLNYAFHYGMCRFYRSPLRGRAQPACSTPRSTPGSRSSSLWR